MSEEDFKKIPPWEQSWLRFVDAHSENIAKVTENAHKWVQENWDGVLTKAGRFLFTSLHGALGLIGYLIGFILVPIYLYYFLKKAPPFLSLRDDGRPRGPGSRRRRVQRRRRYHRRRDRAAWKLIKQGAIEEKEIAECLQTL